MITYSIFKHEWKTSNYPCEVPKSKDYRVYINGEEIPVYTCRISSYPFNIWWQGHQRPVNQTEIVSYVNLIADEDVRIEVEPLTQTAYKRIMLKPYSKGIKTEQINNRIVFTLKENGSYVLELDDYHGLLYVFNNKPIACDNPETVTYYFDKGVHFPGKIVLKSNESIYVDKDALVYGCIYAENAENIKIYGNGIFDDSGEERFSEPCYEPYTNGNVKFYDCTNVKIHGVGFTNSAIWCVNLFHCSDVEIDGIKVFGQWRYNTDGIDIVNSEGIVIRNSFVHSFDDTIVVKGIDRYASYSNKDMLIENCVLWCDWGKTCEIGLETNCPEYDNIIFRNCDILRAGNTACDIQNGDCADVHDILFEDIRVELEDFYTPAMLQPEQSIVYDKHNELEIPAIINIVNTRFRKKYDFMDGMQSAMPYEKQPGDKLFASVRNITFKDIQVYCDEKIFERVNPKEAIWLIVRNTIDTSTYSDITIDNISMNGKCLAREEMSIELIGNIENVKIECER